MLPKEAINKFKQVYLKHYNVELSDDEASLRANNLLNLYKVVYGGDDLAKERASLSDKESRNL